MNFSDLAKFQPKQIEALNAIKTHAYTLYGGAAGGGKSYLLRWAGVYLLLSWAAKYKLKNIRIGLFCEDYPSLRDRQLTKIKFEFPDWLGTFNQSNNEFTLADRYGSGVISFRNLDDASKYLSSEFAAILIDELTRNNRETFDFLNMRRRWPGVTDTKFIGASNPGGVGHCVPDGEVLTKNGWKSIIGVNVGEEVMTLTDNNELQFVRVDQKIKEYYDGYIIKSHNWSARFECTPNHKIAIQTETKNGLGRTFHKPSLRMVSDLAKVSRLPKLGEWAGKEIKTFSIKNIETRKSRLIQPYTLSGDNFCELMGWFLSEGSIVISSHQARFDIHQMKSYNRVLIRELLTRCGFKFSETKKSFSVYSRSWAVYLSKYGKCRDKFIPKIIKNSTKKQLNIFATSALLGDGHNHHYYTISKQLADDMQEVFFKLGYPTYLTSRKRHNRIGLTYDVSFKENKIGWIERCKTTPYKYKGNVYCLGVDGLHRFYIRQNGVIYLSGNSWVKKLWLEKDFTGEAFKPEDFAFVSAKASDNKYLGEAYSQQLETLPEKLRKAYKDGNWDIFAGQFFTEWDKDKHVVDPFEIPEGWLRVRGLDYGNVNPSACYWGAVDYDGNVWIYRELYETGLTYSQLGQKIRLLTPKNEMVEYTAADTSMFAKTLDTGEYGQDILDKEGVPITPANKDRIASLNLMREYLRKGRLKFFSTCSNAIRTIPSLVHSETKPEDVDTAGDDHALDSIRYMLMSLPPTPIKERDRIVNPYEDDGPWQQGRSEDVYSYDNFKL